MLGYDLYEASVILFLLLPKHMWNTSIGVLFERVKVAEPRVIIICIFNRWPELVFL
jgi:hypothetical protein